MKPAVSLSVAALAVVSCTVEPAAPPGGSPGGAAGNAAGASGAAGTTPAGGGAGLAGVGGAASGSAGTGATGGVASAGQAGASGAGAVGTGGSAGSAGQSGASGMAGSAGASAFCDNGAFAICESFEGTVGGQIPTGWSKSGSVEVVTDVAYRGTHSLRVNAAPSGARRITRSGSVVAGLGGAHWGRIYYRVQTPTPAVFVHSTIVAGAAQSPIDAVDIEVRFVDTVQNAGRMHQFLYNVQPTGRAEFGTGSAYTWQFENAWHCAEWHVDHATQSYAFYFDRSEVTQIRIANGANNFQNAEIPQSFSSLSFGWNNYQGAAPGFVAWLDEIAVAATRIGCGP